MLTFWEIDDFPTDKSGGKKYHPQKSKHREEIQNKLNASWCNNFPLLVNDMESNTWCPNITSALGMEKLSIKYLTRQWIQNK